jgi:hypothetical protein
MNVGGRLACIVSLMLASAAHAAPPSTRPTPRWEQTGTIAAPEANQAAAADEKFVYAIGNETIVKYDRASGMRVAASTGPAHHLNSGFFHEGLLYCAHSNFPKKPESSQLFVLDPRTMQLTVFKDFGNYGGSLTWVVFHDDYWWCNFALYEKENGRTFLVKFDKDWKEVARWTYPPELIARLGKWSFSGGIWRDGFLVVTGHDGPELFRLRLPKEGTVVKWVDEQRVPFSGQGIAADPVTGGLVGIKRAKATGQIVFAMPDGGKR